MPGLSSVRDLIGFYVAQRITGFSVSPEPHFDDATRTRFEKELRSANLYLEFGSGGSTLLADKLGIRTVSVENDPFFAKAVRNSLGHGARSTVLDASIGLTRQWGRPIMRRLSKDRLRRWQRYVERPWPVLREMGDFPDFILVDGRFRRACALESARRAIQADHQASLLFDDYFTPGKEHYHAVESIMGKPERVGRSAIFQLNRSSVTRMPTVEDVAAANRDPE